MATKFERVKMSYSSQSEIDDMARIQEETGYSVSDVLRAAMNKAHGLNWPVPLYRKDQADIAPATHAVRAFRERERAAKKKNSKKKSKK